MALPAPIMIVLPAEAHNMNLIINKPCKSSVIVLKQFKLSVIIILMSEQNLLVVGLHG